MSPLACRAQGFASPLRALCARLRYGARSSPWAWRGGCGASPGWPGWLSAAVFFVSGGALWLLSLSFRLGLSWCRVVLRSRRWPRRGGGRSSGLRLVRVLSGGACVRRPVRFRVRSSSSGSRRRRLLRGSRVRGRAGSVSRSRSAVSVAGRVRPCSGFPCLSRFRRRCAWRFRLCFRLPRGFPGVLRVLGLLPLPVLVGAVAGCRVRWLARAGARALAVRAPSPALAALVCRRARAFGLPPRRVSARLVLLPASRVAPLSSASRRCFGPPALPPVPPPPPAQQSLF